MALVDNKSKKDKEITDKSSKNEQSKNEKENKIKDKNKDDKKEQNKLSQQELRINELKKQLEQYFAPQNVAQDHYLQSNMTKDGFVDVSILYNLKLIQDLIKKDKSILITAIRQSKFLKMNSQETMVKYSALIERKTLIIRDLPSNTPKKDVNKLFENNKCSKPKEIKSDIGDNWFITFNSEENCLKTYYYLRDNVKYKNKKLNVRIKTVNSTMTKAEALYSPDRHGAHTHSHKQPNTPTRYQSQYTFPNTYPTITPQGYPSPINAPVPIPMMLPPEYSPYRPNNTTTTTTTTTTSTNKTNNQPTKKQKEQPQPQPPPTTTTTVPQQIIQPQGIISKNDISIKKEHTDSDYPSKFLKYDRKKFLEIYKKLAETPDGLKIPETMRGRDNRIISEEIIPPVSIKAKLNEETKQNEKNKMQSGKYYPQDIERRYHKKRQNNNNNNYNYNYNYYNNNDEDDEYYNYYYSRSKSTKSKSKSKSSKSRAYYPSKYDYNYRRNKNKQYRPRKKPTTNNKKTNNNNNNNNNNDEIVYAPTGRKNYYKGWKPKSNN